MGHEKYDIVSYVLGELDQQSSLLCSSHIAECNSCSEEYTRFKSLLDYIDGDKGNLINEDPYRVDASVSAMVAEFRNKLENKQRRYNFIPVFAYSFAALLLITLSSVIFFTGSGDPQLNIADVTGDVLIRDIDTGKSIDPSGGIVTPFKVKVETRFNGVTNLKLNNDGISEISIAFVPETTAILSFDGSDRMIDLDRGAILLTANNVRTSYKVMSADMIAMISSDSEVEIVAQEVLKIPVYINKGEQKKSHVWSYTNKSIRDVVKDISSTLDKRFELSSPKIGDFVINFYSDSRESNALFNDLVKQLEEQNLTVVRKSKDTYTINILVGDIAKMIDRRLLVKVYRGEASISRKGTAVKIAGGKSATITKTLDVAVNDLSDEFKGKNIAGIQADYQQLRGRLEPKVIHTDSQRCIVEYDLGGRYITDISKQINRDLIRNLIGTDDFVMPWLQ